MTINIKDNVQDTIAIMKLTANIFQRSAEQLEKQFAALENGSSPVVTDDVEKVEEKRPAKKVKKTSKKTEVEKELTLNDVRQAFKNCAVENTPQHAISLLKNLNVGALTELDAGQFKDAIKVFKGE